MNNKVVLVLVDGMRPDGIEQCGNPYLLDLKKESTSCFHSTTIMPSVTLPCHTSLFLSVNPERHGITTNLWMPPVRPIDGICEAVNKNDKKSAMLYNWEELRDLSRPGSLSFSHFQKMLDDDNACMQSEQEMTDIAINYIKKEAPDFMFLYLGYVDIAGHNYGWMGKEYLAGIANASNCIKKLKETLPKDYQLIITADHGGHERNHGNDIPEDMTIPIIFNGSAFEKGMELDSVNIKDIAPTITKVLDVKTPTEWQGKSII